MSPEAPIRVTVLSPSAEVTPSQFHAWFSAEVTAIDDLMSAGRHEYHGSLIHLFLPDAVVLGIGQHHLGELLDHVTKQSGNVHRLFLHPVKEPLTAQQKKAAMEIVRADLEAFAVIQAAKGGSSSDGSLSSQ